MRELVDKYDPKEMEWAIKHTATMAETATARWVIVFTIISIYISWTMFPGFIACWFVLCGIIVGFLVGIVREKDLEARQQELRCLMEIHAMERKKVRASLNDSIDPHPKPARSDIDVPKKYVRELSEIPYCEKCYSRLAWNQSKGTWWCGSCGAWIDSSKEKPLPKLFPKNISCTNCGHLIIVEKAGMFSCSECGHSSILDQFGLVFPEEPIGE